MKIYEIPSGTKIVLRDSEGNTVKLTYQHMDGMYALCTLADGSPVNITGWTEAEISNE